MKKLLIYPFDIETAPLARYAKMVEGYDAVIPVAEWSAWGDADVIDASFYDGGHSVGINVTDDFEASVKQADAVLFAGGIRDKPKASRYYSLSKELGMDAMVCESAFESLGITHADCTAIASKKYEAEVSADSKLLSIPVPVVMVTGYGRQCSKFDIQLGLRKRFQELGYTVCQVGTKEYSPMFDFQALPQFPDEPMWRKTLLYNRFFRGIVINEKPDVLIVGAPGGTMPIDNQHHELFGETAIAIALSLRPDLAIHSLYLSMVNDKNLSDLRNHARYALGMNIDCFHMSNTQMVFEQDRRTINYLTTDSDMVSKILEESSDELSEKLFSVFIPGTCSDAFDDMIMQLQNNIDAI